MGKMFDNNKICLPTRSDSFLPNGKKRFKFLIGFVVVPRRLMCVDLSPGSGLSKFRKNVVESSWNVMAHGDTREEKWRGNKRMEWATSKCHMAAEHRLARAVKTLQADMHSSPASSRLNWLPRRFKWTRPFGRKTKSGFCACAITFQTQSAFTFKGWEVKEGSERKREVSLSTEWRIRSQNRFGNRGQNSFARVHRGLHSLTTMWLIVSHSGIENAPVLETKDDKPLNISCHKPIEGQRYLINYVRKYSIFLYFIPTELLL